jgi:hypothetical protein
LSFHPQATKSLIFLNSSGIIDMGISILGPRTPDSLTTYSHVIAPHTARTLQDRRSTSQL